MPVLLLSPNVTDDTLLLTAAAEKAGWAVVRPKGWPPPAELAQQPEPALSAEPTLGRRMAAHLGWELIDVTDNWLTQLPAEYLGRAVAATTLAEARRQPGPRFVKPAGSVTQAFRSRVYDDPARIGIEHGLPDDLPVQVAEPVRFGPEFRGFVLDRTVTTYSLAYRDGVMNGYGQGRRTITTREALDAQDFFRRVLSDPKVQVPKAFVLDVGFLPDRGWAVVEANPAWSSAMFGCDPSRVLPVLRGACYRRMGGAPPPALRPLATNF